MTFFAPWRVRRPFRRTVFLPGSGSAAFSPLSLFAGGVVGAWYDPSDLTTLFKDTAGLTPVTAAGDTVALMRDKSGNGAHATQATAASRPTYAVVPLGGRRNNLLYSDLTSSWVAGTAVTNTADATVSPLGANTARKIAETTTNERHIVSQDNNALVLSATYTLSGYAKKVDRDWLMLRVGVSFSTNALEVWFNVNTGTVGTNTRANSSAPSYVGAAVQDMGSGWWRCSVTFTCATAGNHYVQLGPSSGDGTQAYVGVAGNSIVFAGAQLETGSTATAYQRVTTQYDVTEAGVQSLSYLSFDGVDDMLGTSAINCGSDKMTLVIGARKASDGTQALIALFGALLNSATGSYAVFGPDTPSDKGYSMKARGASTTTAAAATNFAAPDSAVLSMAADLGISTDAVVARRNGTQVAASGASTPGAANFGNHSLYLGRRDTGTLPWSGSLYGYIMRAAATDAGTLANTERWLAAKSGVTL